jgi:hypothetical protein
MKEDPRKQNEREVSTGDEMDTNVINYKDIESVNGPKLV